MLGLCCCLGFSLVTVNGGYSLVVVQGCLISVASTMAGGFLTTKPPGKTPQDCTGGDPEGDPPSGGCCLRCDLISSVNTSVCIS